MWGQVPPSVRFSGLYAGSDYSCALDATDAVQCWGSGARTPPTGTFTAVRAGRGAVAPTPHPRKIFSIARPFASSSTSLSR
jgi:hypothetical protein